MDTLVQIIGASASYGSHNVLHDISLTLNRGEIVGLIGINGAGKSTLVNLLVGRHPLSEGRMILSDEPYSPESLEEAQACGVGVISQNAEPPQGLTVAQALFRNTYRAQESHEDLRGRAQELLDSAEVDLDLDALVTDLDRGRRALVEVVRMLAEEAQLVVIDEVAVTLADHEIAMLHHVLRQLSKQGRGILYITHRMDEVQSIVNRVIVIREGSIAIDRRTAGLSAEDLTVMLFEDLPELEKPKESSADVDTSSAITVIDLEAEGRLNGVELHVRPGEVVGVTGTHDSGVRELVEILGGMQKPTSGRIERHGEPVEFESRQDAENKGVSYLADSVPSLFPERRLVEGVTQKSNALGDEIRRARRMIELVRELRINTTNINSALDQLSGGDQQKAEFVRTIERGGEVLVLAHPTQGVDVAARRAVFAFLHGLASKGTAVIFMSTDMTELLQWSHRVAVLADGKIALEGAPKDLNEDALMGAMLGANATERLGRRARSAAAADSASASASASVSADDASESHEDIVDAEIEEGAHENSSNDASSVEASDAHPEDAATEASDDASATAESDDDVEVVEPELVDDESSDDNVIEGEVEDDHTVDMADILR